MNIAILITTPDFAGTNIQNSLLLQASWEKTAFMFENKPVWMLKTPHNIIYMFVTDTRCISCEHYDQKIMRCLSDAGIIFPIGLLLFPTTHRSEKGVQSICVHSPGNFGSNELGGSAHQLCPTRPAVQRFLWEQLKQQFSDISTHEVVMEATHHGPALDVPTLFVEIGSNEESWKNPVLGKQVAATILSLLNASIPIIEQRFIPAFGIGGPHYAPHFLKLMEKTNYAFGHLCAKYALEFLNEDLLHQALSLSGAKIVFLDWKGLGDKKQDVQQLLEKNTIPCKRIDRIL